MEGFDMKILLGQERHGQGRINLIIGIQFTLVLI